jgi:hypothetical protein
MYNLSPRLSELENETLDMTDSMIDCQEFIKLLSEYLLPDTSFTDSNTSRVIYQWHNPNKNLTLSITIIPNRDRKSYSINNPTLSKLIEKGEFNTQKELIIGILKFLLK